MLSTKKIRKPLLEFLGTDKNYHSLNECVIHLENLLELTEDEKQLRYEGKQRLKIFRHRVVNAVSQFRIAELIEDETKPGDASFRINEEGLKLLERKYNEITNKILKEYGKYSLIDESNMKEEIRDSEEPTEETFDELVKTHAKQIQLDLLKQIMNRCSSEGFEKLCLKLLVKMGYGESKHTGKAGDRGVDGIISEDKLGLKQIYVQTKKHQQNVPYDEVAKFFGKCAHDKVPGIFITTSDFSKNTMDEMENESIKLISGIKFVQYLYDFDVGFEIAEKYELKKSCPDVLDEFFN